MGTVYELVVQKDEDVKDVIEKFVLEKGWESAYISGAIGSARDVTFTAPVSMDFPPKVGNTLCVGPGEVLAFTGEITKRELMDPALEAIYKDAGPLFIHIHASMAVAGGHVYGGGFKAGKAFRAVKIYIQQI
ncbi:MAG: DNA-binding protein [Ruthenibacterium sp.]